jgi:putative glutamine amidotransferase
MTTRRPVIGIPCSAFTEAWYTPANGNSISYLRAVEAAGGVPLLIHLSDDAAVLDTLYQHIDGLLLAGGVDVDPASYQASRHPALEATDPAQDAVEITLARRAVADGMPVLGICRGIQLLNVALGGSLYQDIDAELPGALDHRASIHQRDMAYLAHPVQLDAASQLAGVLDCGELVVNTLHHQALRDLAPGVRVVARAPDGVVEGIEGAGAGYLLAVQCHPEELWAAADPRWRRMFESFITAARA